MFFVGACAWLCMGEHLHPWLGSISLIWRVVTFRGQGDKSIVNEFSIKAPDSSSGVSDQQSIGLSPGQDTPSTIIIIIIIIKPFFYSAYHFEVPMRCERKSTIIVQSKQICFQPGFELF